MIRRWTHLAALAVALTAAGSARAADFYLVAKPFAKAMPDGTVVPMWGFAPATSAFVPLAEATAPGPMLEVPAGDTTVNIHLKNELPEPASVVVPGQRAALAPASVLDGQGRQRIRSFAAETAPGATRTYSFTGVTPGTFLYQSGSHPAVQVPMGLYGALVVPASATTAYPGVEFDNEAVAVLSEIDPRLNAAVNAGAFGTAAYPSTIRFAPTWFLINGQPYPAARIETAAPAAAGQRILLRLLNAGLDSHVAAFQGLTASLVAEDGQPYRAARQAFSCLLAAGKTADAVVIAGADGLYPIYDRSFSTTSNGSEPGGMLAYLAVGTALPAAPLLSPTQPLALADSYTLAEDAVLNVPAGGVLANDAGSNLAASLVSGPASGALTLRPDGSFTYTPSADFNGSVSFVYRAGAGSLATQAAATLTVTPVNDRPLALADAATVNAGSAVNVSVLGNDTDPDGDRLTITQVGSAAHGRVTLESDGSLTYLADAGWSGQDAFAYTVSDGALTTSGTVTITVKAVQNLAPSAIADSARTRRNRGVVIKVLANDIDRDGRLDPATVETTLPTRKGKVFVQADGSILFVPRARFAGYDQFTYRVRDDKGAWSNWAKVRVKVQ